MIYMNTLGTKLLHTNKKSRTKLSVFNQSIAYVRFKSEINQISSSSRKVVVDIYILLQ